MTDRSGSSNKCRLWLCALIAMAMLVAVGAPIAGATHTDEHVEFGYNATPTDSTTVETGSEYTHQFSVQTNATDGPLVFVTYYNQSADIAYSAHTVELNGTEIETRVNVSTVTADGNNLTRVRITNRSLPNDGQRTYDVEVDVSAPDSVTDELVYTGGTHGPSGKVLPLQTTALATESPDDDTPGGDDGGDGGEGGDGGDGGDGGGGGFSGGGGYGGVGSDGGDDDSFDSPQATADDFPVIEVDPVVVEQVEVDGGVAAFNRTSSVSRVQYAENMSAAVTVSEFDGIAEGTTETFTERIRSNVSSIDNTTEVNVITVVDISPNSTTSSNQTPATIAITVAAEELDDPNNATIVHRADTGWEERATAAQSNGNGTVTLTAEVESFSLFAVTEMSPGDADGTQSESTGDSSGTESTSTGDSSETDPEPDSSDDADSDTSQTDNASPSTEEQSPINPVNIAGLAGLVIVILLAVVAVRRLQ